MLFEHFSFESWVMLGFLSFLDALDGNPEYSFQFNIRTPFRRGAGSAFGIPSGFDLSINIVTITLLIMFVIVFLLLFSWLGARGRFCYTYSVAVKKARIRIPWKSYTHEANSFFLTRLGTLLGTLFIILLFLGGYIFMAILIFHKNTPPESPLELLKIFLYSFPALLFLFVAILFLTLMLIWLDDFVVPIQMFTRSTCMPAIRRTWEITKEHPWSFILYFLTKLVITLVGFGFYLLGGLLTCCVGLCFLFIPVVGQTLLQPLLLFLQAFPLYFLRQLGDDFDFTQRIPLDPAPSFLSPSSDTFSHLVEE